QEELARDEPRAVVAPIDAPVETEPLLITDRILQANRTSQDLREPREKAAQEGETTYSLENGLLLAKGRVVVPDQDDLRMLLIREAHDQRPIAYPGRKKTIRVLRDRYYWKGMTSDIEQYIRNCYTCRRTHVPRDKTPGLLDRKSTRLNSSH